MKLDFVETLNCKELENIALQRKISELNSRLSELVAQNDELSKSNEEIKSQINIMKKLEGDGLLKEEYEAILKEYDFSPLHFLRCDFQEKKPCSRMQ